MLPPTHIPSTTASPLTSPGPADNGFSAGEAGRGRDWAVPGLIALAVVLLAPWWFGATQPLVQGAVGWALLAALGLWLVGLFLSDRVTIPMPAVLIPLLLGTLWAMFQLVPLPLDLLETLSPSAAGLWRSTGVEASGGGWFSLSLFPASTRTDTAWVVLATLVLMLGARFFHRPAAQLWLWRLLAINGAALAVFGIIQKLTFNGKLYWVIEPYEMTTPFGPFVNRSNAAGYLLMCLAGAVGWMSLGRRDAAPRTDVTSVSNHKPSGPVSIWPYVAAILIVAGILCSFSRGAIVAMAAAGLVTLFWARGSFGNLRPVLATVTIIGLTLLGLAWIGLTAPLGDRMATLLDQSARPDQRLSHWEDSLQASREYLSTGSGLGTYRYAYLPHAKAADEEWFYYAENQYLQSLLEAGVPGLLLVLLAIGLVVVSARWLLVQGGSPAIRAAGLAGFFAITSQAIHACFDFGLYLPSNMLLLALLCGAVTGMAAATSQWPRPPRLIALPAIRTRPVAIGLVLLLSAQAVFGLGELLARRVVSSGKLSLRAALRHPGVSAGELAMELRQFDADLAHQPGDAESHRLAARGWIEVYRRRAAAALQAAAGQSATTGQIRTDPSMTDPSMLRYQATRYARQGNLAALALVRSDKIISETLGPATRHLRAARRGCPLLPWVHLQLGELSFLVEDPLAENRHLEPLLALAGRRGNVMYHAGQLHYQSGRTAEALRFWQLSLKASPRFDSLILPLAAAQIGMSRVVEELLPADPTRLVVLAGEHYSGEASLEERQLVLARAQALLPRSGLSPAGRLYLQGKIQILSQEPSRAVDSLHSAVTLAPRNTQWRFELARLLTDQGRLDDAELHARLCAQLSPNDIRYRKLFHEVHLRQARAASGLGTADPDDLSIESDREAKP